jgi:hypothetical protein
MLEGRCVIGTSIVSISLNSLKTVGPETDSTKIENLITMRLSKEGLRRPYSSPATHNLFSMDGIEAGLPLTLGGTPQPRHPAICIYDPLSRWSPEGL